MLAKESFLCSPPHPLFDQYGTNAAFTFPAVHQVLVARQLSCCSDGRYAATVSSMAICQPPSPHFIWKLEVFIVHYLSFDFTEVFNLYPSLLSEAHYIKPSISKQCT